MKRRDSVPSAILVTLLVVSACSTPPGSGSIDGMDIGLRTELHLDDLARAGDPDPEATRTARDLVENSPRWLDSLRVYSAIADMEEDGSVAVDLWVLPFDSTEGGGMLALAIDSDGHVIRSRAWGNETFDADPNASWENFWRQFEYDNSRRIVNPEMALSAADVRSYSDTLDADTTDVAALARLMYEHRLIMYDHNYFLRRSMAVSGGDGVPPLEWIDEFRGTYRRMNKVADELRPVIGDSAAARYVDVVDTGADILALVAQSAAAGDGDAVREQVLSFRRQTCGACHGIEDHAAGPGKLKAALYDRLDDFGVRRELFAVGLDVWAVPEDVSGSQAMSDAVKAILVIAGSQ